MSYQTIKCTFLNLRMMDQNRPPQSTTGLLSSPTRTDALTTSRTTGGVQFCRSIHVVGQGQVASAPLTEKIGGDVGSSGSSGSGVRPADIEISSSKPWYGEEPPLSMYAEDTVFVRREAGIWCRRYIRGRLYPVNRIGDSARDQKLLRNPAGLIETNGDQVL